MCRAGSGNAADRKYWWGGGAMTSVIVRRKEGKRLSCNAGPHEVVTDRKPEDGGTDAGCTSGELLLMAIGSCATGSVRTYLEFQERAVPRPLHRGELPALGKRRRA